jgi:hypothetical protein
MIGSSGRQKSIRLWNKITSHRCLHNKCHHLRCSSRVFHPISWSIHMPWQTGLRTFLLEIGCPHQHSLNPFMRQLTSTVRVLMQGLMLMTGLLAHLRWRTILLRRGSGGSEQRNALGRSTLGFKLRGILMQTHGLYTIHFRLQDQEGRQEHSSDLGTLSSPDIYYFYRFQYLLLLFVLLFSLV